MKTRSLTWQPAPVRSTACTESRCGAAAKPVHQQTCLAGGRLLLCAFLNRTMGSGRGAVLLLQLSPIHGQTSLPHCTGAHAELSMRHGHAQAPCASQRAAAARFGWRRMRHHCVSARVGDTAATSDKFGEVAASVYPTTAAAHVLTLLPTACNPGGPAATVFAWRASCRWGIFRRDILISHRNCCAVSIVERRMLMHVSCSHFNTG